MRPQITFFIIVVLIVLGIINYPKIDYLVYGTTEYNVTYETYYRPFNTTTDDITVIEKKVETTTKFNPIFNSTNVTISTSETNWNKHVSINFPGSSSIDYNLKGVAETALANTDPKTIMNITSINIVPQYKVASVCKDTDSLGCFSRPDLDIYISNLDAYSNTCNTFGNTLYHEIGHADRYSKFGDAPKQIEEDYASNYADRVTKDKCSTSKFISLEKNLKEKSDAYNDSLEAISKWDKYSGVSCNEAQLEISSEISFNINRPQVCVFRPDIYGIPADLYNEYLVDYNRYKKSVDEYNTVLREVEAYLSDPMLRIFSQE